MRNKLAKVALALAATTVFAAAGTAAAVAADDAFHVAVLGGLSAKGVLADNANTSVLATRASVALINKAGGINGHQVVLTVIDDQGNPTVAVTKLRGLINSPDKPSVVLNSGPSGVADATLPILSQAGILSLNIGPTTTSFDPKKFPLNFDLSPSPTNYAAGFLDYIKSKGYKSVGIIHGSSAYGESFGKLMQQVLTTGGINVTANEEYDNASLDMTPQVDKVRSTAPEALIVDGYGPVVGYVLQSIQKLGWDIPMLGDNSIAATGLTSKKPPEGVLGTDAVKNLVMQVFQSTKYDPNATAVNQAVDAMKAVGEIKASLIVAYNLDSMALVSAAAKAANSIDPKAIAAALETDAVTADAHTVILKKYNFTKDSHAANPSTDSMTFISPSELKNGQFQ